MNEENARKLLFEIDDILNDISLPYFLYGGTCLGAIREKRFISIDLDIDLACLAEDFIPKIELLREELNKNGFETHWLDHRHKEKWSGGYYGVKIKKHGINCDFVAFSKYDKNRMFVPSHFDRFVLVHEKEYMQHNKKIQFYGRTFFVPEDTDGYLTEKYGDWRTPHKSFYNVSKSRVYAVGMTCGGFDMFHLGHINLLKQAREKCDKLIVGISSDERILQKKGESPLLSYDDRVYLVSLSGYADIIDKLGIEGKKPLVEKHNPDILLVGDDWTPETYEGYNLRPVVFLQRTRNVSSSWYRQKIRR